MVAMKKVFLVPLFTFIIAPITFIITYGMAVANDHVTPLFPYISETGSKPPESCIFAQFLNIAAFLMVIAIYVKYRQIIEFSRLRPSRAICEKKNKISVYLGAVACLGLDIVANFQESNLLLVHMLGAGMCFVPGVAYFCLQSSFSRKMCPEICSRKAVLTRYCLSVTCIIFATTTIIPGIVSITLFKGDDRRKWTQEDGGYAWHLVSTFSEWLLVLFFCSFILSYVFEFRKIVIDRPVIRLTNIEEEDSPNNNDIKTIDIKV